MIINMKNVIENKNISWKAKGVYVYIAECGEENLSTEKIVENGTDGRYAVLDAVRELELAGIIFREKSQSGKMKYIIKQ